MIVVTGATGRLGRMVVQHLVKRVPPERVAASVRDPSKAQDLTELGVRIRHGDFTKPDSLAQAFEGATQVFVVSSNAAATGGDPLAQHRAAFEAAKAAGARRIVYTSHMGASATSAFPPMHDHAATEDMLKESGVAWTAVRDGFYASSGIAFLGDWQNSGRIEAPADGPVSWTAHEDLAEAAAAILAEEGRFDGPTPPLTGAEAIDLADVARIASELLGRPVERKAIPEEVLEQRMSARGVPRPSIGIALGFYRAARDGEFARVDPTLEALIGRPPQTMRDLLASEITRNVN